MVNNKVLSLDNPIKKILSPWISRNLVLEELGGLYGNTILHEMGEIIKYYDIYRQGADFPVNTEDFVPSQLNFKKIRALIDKEARFMFAKPIDVLINPKDVNDTENPNISNMQAYVNKVLEVNNFNSKILKAIKDCLIGKRIAIVCNFSSEYGITISFLPSLEFVYDTDRYGKLNKLIAFHSLNDENQSNKQRIQRKKYWIEKGFCHVSEGIYDGAGNLIEMVLEDETTYFEYIPAVIILNDGLTGDMFGESEVYNLFAYEQYYSKFANKDMDAEGKGMNPIMYTRDMSADSTDDLSLAAGAFWDLHSDETVSDDRVGDVGILEPTLNYTEALKNTLNRVRDSMYEQVDMPCVTTEDLKGVVSSGKTLKAIYWGFTVRCDEKMIVWKDGIKAIIKCLIDGAKLYAEIAQPYTDGNNFDDTKYIIKIDNSYPLPDDEAEEKATDLAEVSHKTRSIKSYIKKWRPELTEKEIDGEIKQMAIEKQILEDSFFPVENPINQNTGAAQEGE